MTDSSPTDPAAARTAAAAYLEQHITALLREQPLQRAPATLALRVMAAIGRRPRSAFQRWPLAVRIGFVLLAGATAHFSSGLIELIETLGTGIAAPRAPMAMTLIETMFTTMRQLPASWSQTAFAVLILIYGCLFGIATAVYRLVNPRY